MRRVGLIAAAAVGVVVIAGAAAWFVLFRDTAEPVTVDQAVTSFRTDTEPTSAGPSPIPEGVYVYATQGFEETDALTGVTHRYPRRSTITVAAHECGVSLTWRVLKGRSTEWVYCVTRDGWELRSQDERHSFFGRTERTTYLCDATPIRPAEPRVGMKWRVTDCATDGTTERGFVRVVDMPRARVGETNVNTVHVRKTTRLAGASRGASRHDLWFESATGLPVKLALVSRTTSASPIGNVGYDEVVALRLVSLEPRR